MNNVAFLILAGFGRVLTVRGLGGNLPVSWPDIQNLSFNERMGEEVLIEAGFARYVSESHFCL